MDIGFVKTSGIIWKVDFGNVWKIEGCREIKGNWGIGRLWNMRKMENIGKIREGLNKQKK